MSTDSPMDFVKSEIASEKVVVFSKSFCPFCKSTKSLFEDNKVDAKIIELNEMDNGNDIQDALQELSGQRTVPNVFINGEHIGGNSDVQAAWSAGELQKKME
jgi:glutaredoxin 3